MMNFYSFALIFVFVHSIRRCDAQSSNAKCGLDGKTVKMTLDNGPSDIYFMTGKGKTCIAGVKNELSFYDAKRSCERLFSGGKMMSEENFNVLQSKIKDSSLQNMILIYMMKGNECGLVSNVPGSSVTLGPCPKTSNQYNYLCEYPMQYNCAWQFEYAEITSSQSSEYAFNVTIYAYRNELGNKTKEDCNMQQSVSYNWQCQLNQLFSEPDAKEWSPCSENCTDFTKPLPTQNMTRKLNPSCIQKSSDAKVLLHSVRTCNGHVPCNASSTGTTTATASSLRLVGIIIGAVVGSVVFAAVVAFGIWFFCCRRKRGNTEVTEKSTSKRSKVSQRSRNSASMQQRSRSQSPGKVKKARKTKETAAGDVVDDSAGIPLVPPPKCSATAFNRK